MVNQSDQFTTSLYKLDKHGVEVSVNVNDVDLFMEIDTGARASLISEDTYHKHFSSTPLMSCMTRLHTYTRESIKVLGQMSSNINYDKQHANLSLVVVEGTGPSLLGRDWLKVIKLKRTIMSTIKTKSTKTMKKKRKLKTSL